MRVFAVVLGILLFGPVLPVFAAKADAPPEDSYGVRDLDEDEGAVLLPDPPSEKSEKSSVNIREEYGFRRRQNIDSFLGEYENPFAPLPEDSTTEGSRSESRDEIDRARGL